MGLDRRPLHPGAVADGGPVRLAEPARDAGVVSRRLVGAARGCGADAARVGRRAIGAERNRVAAQGRDERGYLVGTAGVRGKLGAGHPIRTDGFTAAVDGADDVSIDPRVMGVCLGSFLRHRAYLSAITSADEQ